MSSRARIFDKAAFHLDSVRAHGLDDHQAVVHAGLYFGWAVERGLVAEWLEARTPEAFAAYRAREISGGGLLARWDGALLEDMFTDEGAAFAAVYLDHQSGSFLDDYLRTMARGLPSEYHVEDSRENHERLAVVLDERYTTWRRGWDPGAPGPRVPGATRTRAPAPPERGRIPILPVTQGIALPPGALSIQVRRPGSVVAIEAARAGDGWLGLVSPAQPGGSSDPTPGDLLQIGVLASVTQIAESPGVPGGLDVGVCCRARIQIEAWGEGWCADVVRLPEPEPTSGDAALLEAVRHGVGEALRSRRRAGEPLGLLALAPTLSGAALLDAVAAELGLSREERLLMLEAPDLMTRAQLVRAALERGR